MIHIVQAEIGVLDLTERARQEVGPIKTLDCSYGFYESLVQSINHCFLVGGIITLYNNRAQGHKL